jgi:hypothetical protein
MDAGGAAASGFFETPGFEAEAALSAPDTFGALTGAFLATAGLLAATGVFAAFLPFAELSARFFPFAGLGLWAGLLEVGAARGFRATALSPADFGAGLGPRFEPARFACGARCFVTFSLLRAIFFSATTAPSGLRRRCYRSHHTAFGAAANAPCRSGL